MAINDDYRRISCFHDLIYINNRYYFPMLSEDIICSMNPNGNDFQIEYIFPRSKARRAYAFHVCAHYGEYLILVPYFADFIALYHIGKKEFKTIDVPKEFKNKDNNVLYGIQEGGTLCLFISNRLCVLTIDIPHLIMDVTIDNNYPLAAFSWYDIKLLCPLKKRYLFYFGFDYVKRGRNLYTIVKNTSYIVKFNIDTGTFSYDCYNVSFASICQYRDKILLLDEVEGTIYEYDGLASRIKVYFSNRQLISLCGESVIKSMVHEGWLYFWKNFSDDIIAMNIDAKEVISIHLGKCTNEGAFNFARIAQKTTAWTIIGDVIQFLSMAHNKIYQLRRGHCIKEYRFPPTSWMGYLDLLFSRLIDESIYRENRFVCCDVFFDLIFKCRIPIKIKSDIKCGKTIYKECVK